MEPYSPLTMSISYFICLTSSLTVACSFSVSNSPINSSNFLFQGVVTARLTNFGGFAKAKVGSRDDAEERP